MNHLFTTTDLERTYRGEHQHDWPRWPAADCYNLKALLSEWLSASTPRPKYAGGTPVTAFSEHGQGRLHILDGLLVAFLVTEVIRIIRHEDGRKAKLIKRFKLTRPRLRRFWKRACAISRQAGDEDSRRAGRTQAREEKRRSKNLRSRRTAEARGTRRAGSGRQRIRRTTSFAHHQRETARRSDVTEVAPDRKPITVILSEKGLGARAAKGHQRDARTLDYKTGDAFRRICARQEQSVAVFIIPPAGWRIRCRHAKLPPRRAATANRSQPTSTAAGRHLGGCDDEQSGRCPFDGDRRRLRVRRQLEAMLPTKRPARRY